MSSENKEILLNCMKCLSSDIKSDLRRTCAEMMLNHDQIPSSTAIDYHLWKHRLPIISHLPEIQKMLFAALTAIGGAIMFKFLYDIIVKTSNPLYLLLIIPGAPALVFGVARLWPIARKIKNRTRK